MTPTIEPIGQSMVERGMGDQEIRIEDIPF
jgi:hypothetical protein